jgi:uncharacterized membrane protein
MVTKKQLIISCIFNGTNTIMFLYYIYDIYLRPIDLEHITRWNYYLNSIFTTICLICDILLYYAKKNKENAQSQNNYILMSENKDEINYIEKINDWNRNKYGVVCNSLSYFVLIGFWSLYFFGNKIMLVSKNVRSWFNSYYHHLFIQAIVIIDIFISDRKKINFSWRYLGIIGAVYAVYCFIIAFEKYVLGRDAYYFMEGKSFIFLIFCFLFTSLFLYISYLIHIYLVQFKLDKLNDNEQGKDICNKIFNSLDKDTDIKLVE